MTISGTSATIAANLREVEAVKFEGLGKVSNRD
jgi:hypothetical protein